ncbi:MAG: K(+)-transporting ATPase subunit C [Verrucomicrobiota bacterium]|jgi:K+-transporting ATPase ATPase C chain
MKNLFTELRSAVMVTLIFALVCCGLYPLIVFGVAQVFFPDQANGSLIVDKDGTVHGSKLLGQQFTADKYFQSRPSAAGNGYDATSSGGSNLGPTSTNLATTIAQRIADYRAKNGLPRGETLRGLATNVPVPADAVTASGSGLDPHISLRNAELQAPRVAKVRNVSVEKVLELVRVNTDPASLGFLGEPGVNVLKLNLALDRLGSQTANKVTENDG